MENTEQIIVFLKKNPNSTKAAISESANIKGIVLFNLLRSLKTEGVIAESFDGENTVFALTENNAGDDTEDNLKQEPEVEIKTDKTETDKLPEKPQIEYPAASRDNSKYKFNGEEFGKGPLVRAVIGQYVVDNPGMTYKKLKETFPDELLKRFGIFQDVDTAASIDGHGKRYFFKEEYIIKLKDKNIVVCNQFTLANIQPFLTKAKALGYKIR